MTHLRSPSDGGAIKRALELIDAYGADPARWPAAEAALFETLCGDPKFEAARKEAAALDAALGAAPGEVASEGLKEAILAQIPTRIASRTWFDAVIDWSTHGLGRLVPLGAAAGLSALGFAIGVTSVGAGAGEEDALYYALDTSMIEFTQSDSLWTEDL